MKQKASVLRFRCTIQYRHRKSYEAESFRITIQMHNLVQASENRTKQKASVLRFGCTIQYRHRKSYEAESFRITIQMHNSVQASENHMTQKSGAHKGNLLFAGNRGNQDCLLYSVGVMPYVFLKLRQKWSTLLKPVCEDMTAILFSVPIRSNAACLSL